MMDLYAWGTTNGRRALVMAEESGLAFRLHEINIQKGDQKTAAYEAINPYRKIPALVDPDGPGGAPASVFESVAICFYLAHKCGRFAGEQRELPDVLKWSMFHATNVLCTFGNLGRIDHPSFEENALKQLEVMNKHLGGREWFAESYSIADIIPFTRLNSLNHERVRIADFPAVAAWLSRVSARPAVRRAMERKFG